MHQQSTPLVTMRMGIQRTAGPRFTLASNECPSTHAFSVLVLFQFLIQTTTAARHLSQTGSNAQPGRGLESDPGPWWRNIAKIHNSAESALPGGFRSTGRNG